MAETPACPLIKVSDFVETSLWLSIENITTRTVLNDNASTELIEIDGERLTLKLPKRTCARGHLLVIQLGTKTFHPLAPESSVLLVSQFVATAKVLTHETIDQTSILVGLKLYQYKKDEWTKFLNDLNNHQKQVNQQVRIIRD